jgi:RNA polymerase sigma-70 factor (ECF subfamily)
VAKSTDECLVDEIRAGRREACAQLIHDHYERVYRFLVHLARDPNQAEDLTQDTFAAAWQKIDDFDARSSLATWLHRIAYGKFVDAYRSERRQSDLLKQVAHKQPITEAGPLEMAAAADDARKLYAALDRLDESERLLLVLHHLQGLSYQEMVEVLQEPSGTIKWRTSQALARLRSLLTQETHHERSQATQ